MKDIFEYYLYKKIHNKEFKLSFKIIKR